MKTDFCFLCSSLKPGGGNRVIYEICQQIHDSSTYTYEILYIDDTGFDEKLSKIIVTETYYNVSFDFENIP